MSNQSDSYSSSPPSTQGERSKALEYPWQYHCQDMLPQCILPLTDASYKGSSGRIAVLGGSALYTGAPYYAATAALQTGADLVTIFTAQEAAMRMPLPTWPTRKLPRLLMQRGMPRDAWTCKSFPS